MTDEENEALLNHEARVLYKRLREIFERIDNGTADKEERGFFTDEMQRILAITDAEIAEAYQRVQTDEDMDEAEKQWARHTIAKFFRGDATAIPKTLWEARNAAAERVLFVLEHPGMQAES